MGAWHKNNLYQKMCILPHHHSGQRNGGRYNRSLHVLLSHQQEADMEC